MAFAYRPKRNGVPTEKWYARYRDHERGGKWRSRAGYTDKRATEALAARLERESARRAEGLAAPPAEGDARRRPVAELVAEYHQDHARHADPRWSRRVYRALNKLAGELGWRDARDLAGPQAADRLARWLAEKRRGPHFGARTSNSYLKAARAFGHWLTRRHVLPVNPFATLKPQNERADPRHRRRVLSPDELRRLVATAEADPRTARGLTGPQRAVLYLLAAYTGLRASELASLTPDSFRLDLDPPTVTLDPRHDKARRGAVLPLHRDVADRLRAHLAGVPAGARLWPGPWARHGMATRMLRRDLDAAGIPYRDDRGECFSFHCFRSYYVTSLALANVPPMVAQKLSRHSTLELMRIYARVRGESLGEAVNRLPPVG